MTRVFENGLMILTHESGLVETFTADEIDKIKNGFDKQKDKANKIIDLLEVYRESIEASNTG